MALGILLKPAFAYPTPPIPGAAVLPDSPNYCAFSLKMLSPQVPAVGLSDQTSGTPASHRGYPQPTCLPLPGYFHTLGCLVAPGCPEHPTV